jgi:hypothetical protein
MFVIVAVAILFVGVVVAIRIASKRAAQQKATHDARLQAMARTYLMAAKKKAAASPAPPEQQQPPVREERECPFCAEPILKKAKVCKHCGRDVEPVA